MLQSTGRIPGRAARLAELSGSDPQRSGCGHQDAAAIAGHDWARQREGAAGFPIARRP